jgi:hypothetical protein
MSSTECYFYKQDPNYPVGKVNYSEGNDYTTPLTSGVVENIDSYTNLPEGSYLLNVYARILATEDASFNSFRLDLETENAVVNQTSYFAYPKAMTDGLPFKIQLNDVITVTNPTNQIDVGIVATYEAGDYELTDFTTNLLKMA